MFLPPAYVSLMVDNLVENRAKTFACLGQTRCITRAWSCETSLPLVWKHSSGKNLSNAYGYPHTNTFRTSFPGEMEGGIAVYVNRVERM